MKHQKRRTHAAQDAVGIGRVLLQMKVHIPAKKRARLRASKKANGKVKRSSDGSVRSTIITYPSRVSKGIQGEWAVVRRQINYGNSIGELKMFQQAQSRILTVLAIVAVGVLAAEGLT